METRQSDRLNRHIDTAIGKRGLPGRKPVRLRQGLPGLLNTELHPAENRGYRELYLAGRQLIHHWRGLASALADTEAAVGLNAGAAAVHELLAELKPLTAEHDLFGGGAVQGSGARIGRARGTLGDRFLERNQAVRFALHDIEHVRTLLGYLAILSETRGHEELPRFCRRWEEGLAEHEDTLRRGAIEMATDPDGAIEPIDDSRLSRGAHRVAFSIGSFGEWLDRRAGRRAG